MPWTFGFDSKRLIVYWTNHNKVQDNQENFKTTTINRWCLRSSFLTRNEWFASDRIPMLRAKNSGIARGQTLPVARRKCMAKSCFHVQKRDFGEKSTPLRRSFIANGLGECWYAENVSFCLNNREIYDKFIDKLLSCLREGYCEIYIVYCNGQNYHKIRYKSSGNNLIELFQFCTGSLWRIFNNNFIWVSNHSSRARVLY